MSLPIIHRGEVEMLGEGDVGIIALLSQLEGDKWGNCILSSNNKIHLTKAQALKLGDMFMRLAEVLK